MNQPAISLYKMNTKLSAVHKALKAFGIENKPTVQAFGSGLINSTWKIVTNDKAYILQRINDAVFKAPEDIADNLRQIANYLHQQSADYLFVTPIPTQYGKDLIHINGEGFYRLLPFVNNSYTKNVVEGPEQAYEAAAQFGKFTRLLTGFNTMQLKITIPDFHNLSLRYKQFLNAIENENKERVGQSQPLITQLKDLNNIVSEYESIKNNPQFKLRVTHHDTKISNVLFDANDKGICVIDLDTVMPGYFISDVGDMMRTYLSPVSEEEKDFDKIEVRDDFYKAIVQGYYNEMKEELTEMERNSFFYAGKFMIYMQALRFLTDHLNNDVYYGAKYEGHNFVRAGNQAMLLEKLIKQQDHLQNIIQHE